jgi:hypothetical protein
MARHRDPVPVDKNVILDLFRADLDRMGGLVGQPEYQGCFQRNGRARRVQLRPRLL